MLAQVIGKAPLDFSTKDGTRICGTTIYYAYEVEGVEGLKADKLFVRDGIDMPKDMEIDSMVNIFFDNRGKVEKISLE
ncbi:MAG: hypothetical protein MR589_09360 [Lachnobacterium sp.]|nr:hypothetical protein [Lachnobacterium sp.]